MGKEVLITGGSGFIGKRLAASLEKDCKVSLLDRNATPLEDVDSLVDIVAGKDVVIHLAGLTRGSAEELDKANVDGTRNILEAISRHKGKKPHFIFASSFAVYEPSSRITENSKTGPRGDYGRSKLKAEDALRQYSKKFNIPTTILRFSNVYGPGIPPFTHSVVANFIHLIQNGQAINLDGDGNQLRDFIYLDDAVDAIKTAISVSPEEESIQTVNICSAGGISVKKLALLIGKVLRKKANINYILENKNDSWAALNFDKAQEILGWRPTVSLNKGLLLTYEKKN